MTNHRSHKRVASAGDASGTLIELERRRGRFYLTRMQAGKVVRVSEIRRDQGIAEVWRAFRSLAYDHEDAWIAVPDKRPMLLT
jgi:hypothetical protein